MCQFSYYKYNACTHWTIECYEQCSRSIWHGGRFGFLRLCTPTIFERSLEWPGLDEDEPPNPVQFLGLTGFCPACVNAFKIHPMSSERDQGFDQTLEYAPGIFDSEDTAPYFIVKAICATIPCCLGIADQYESEQLNQGASVLFKQQSIISLSWAELRRMQPFRVLGKMEGVEGPMPIEQILIALDCAGGFTTADTQTLSRALERGENLLALFDTGFKDRGMPFSYFSDAMRRVQENARQVLAEMQNEQRGMQEVAGAASVSIPVADLEPAALIENLGLPGHENADGEDIDGEDSHLMGIQRESVGYPKSRSPKFINRFPSNFQDQPAQTEPEWKKSKAVPTRTQPPRQAKSAFTSSKKSFNKTQSLSSDGSQLDGVAQSTPGIRQDATLHSIPFGRLSMVDSQPRTASGTQSALGTSMSEESLEIQTAHLNQHKQKPRMLPPKPAGPNKRDASAMYGNLEQIPAPKRVRK